MKNIFPFFLAILLFGCKNHPPQDEAIQPPENVTVQELTLGDDTRTFLSISDIHLDIDADTIQQEGHGWTDTDKKLWELTKAKLTEIVGKKDRLKIDFMVFTGDIPFHSTDDALRAKNIGVVLTFLSELSDRNGLPLLFVPGNNDGLAGDYASFRNDKDEPPYVRDSINSSKWPFIGNKGICGGSGNGSCYIDSSTVYGYYSAYPLANKELRFIGLNTVIHNNREHKPICYNPPADGKRQAIAAQIQMDWFLAQMKAANQADEKVLIAMHIPPGLNGYSGHPFWADFATSNGTTIYNAFYQSILQHRDNVVGILVGHSHQDELKMILDDQSKVVDLCIYTPGITPQHGNNPGFKLFSYHTESYELLDFMTIWGDFFSQKKVQPFEHSYTFNHVYNNYNNQSMTQRLAHLWDKDSLAFIQTGMGKTFKVGQTYSLSDKEKTGMEMRYDAGAVAIHHSKCEE